MSDHNSTGQQKNNHIAIFASGTGSNTQKIIEYFTAPLTFLKKDRRTKVVLIVSNNANAGVLKIAEKEKIQSLIIERKKFYEGGYLSDLKKYKIDLIVLAGFLWKIPSILIQSYQNKIINIHPALLPKFGGKGMYGNKVHEAVINSKEKESGISIHYVDELYDHGTIIFQARCKIEDDDTPDMLAGKIHSLEHQYYPLIIEKIIMNQQ